MKLRILFLFIFFFCSMQVNAESFLFPKEPPIKVRLIYSLDKIKITFKADWILADSSGYLENKYADKDSVTLALIGDYIEIIQSNKIVSVFSKVLKLKSLQQSATLMIKDVPYGIGWWWAGQEDRIYEGDFEIRKNEKNKFDVILSLPLEKYIRGVIPYEIGNDAPPEALKAQAVAARSEAVEALVSGKYRGKHFDLCADVECQVFGGNYKRTPITDSAVEATKGLCLFYKDKVISAYYASNCGGVSENIENVWPQRSGPAPYWSSHADSDKKNQMDLSKEADVKEWILSSPDVYCNPRFHPGLPAWSKRNFRWSVEMTSEELSENVNEMKKIGKLQKVSPLKRGKSGRLIKAAFIGLTDTLILSSELEIRKIRKPPFRSSCFIFKKSAIDSLPVNYIFKGAGWGHGVGMCQSGAVSRAMAGQNFKDILKHYFRETGIKTVFPF